MVSQIITSESGGTRAVKKGAKKALPLIAINSKAKKKGAHFEHLNYHLLSILIVVYHDLLSDAEMAEDVVECFLARNGATRDVAKLNEYELEVFGNKVATKSEVEGFTNTSQMG